MSELIGAVTIGQSPRSDIMPGMKESMGPHIRVVEKGALDGLSMQNILALAPTEGMSPLCTRLKDGRQVVIAEERVIPLMQERISELETMGVSLVVLLCTGHFPLFQFRGLILEAQRIVDRCVEAVVRSSNTLALVVPLPEQIDQAVRNLSHVTSNIKAVSASPYAPIDEVRRAGQSLQESCADLIVMHCMGFQNEHRRIMREVTGKPVIVANALVARTIGELLQT
jgi:protein AroM